MPFANDKKVDLIALVHSKTKGFAKTNVLATNFKSPGEVTLL